MLGEDFCFGNRWLSEFGMSMFDPEDSQEWVSREIEKSDITSIRAIPNHYSTRYNDTLTLHFLILKNEDMCESKTDYKLSKFEINGLRAWLESPTQPTELQVVEPNNNEPDVRYFGVFTNVQPYILSQECYGLYLTFTCNAPYGFSELKTSTFNVNSQNNFVEKNVYIHTSEVLQGVYPIIKIYADEEFGNSDSVYIENASDSGNSMFLHLPSDVAELIIDCKKKIVTNEDGEIVPISSIIDNSTVDDGYGLLSLLNQDIYWLKLIQGKNNLVITPSQSNSIKKVEITYRDIIKSGGF